MTFGENTVSSLTLVEQRKKLQPNRTIAKDNSNLLGFAEANLIAALSIRKPSKARGRNIINNPF